MKILQINTVYQSKSTGRTCYEVEKALKKQGHECITAYGTGHTYSDSCYKIGSDLEYYFHNLMSRLTGLEGYYSYFATRRFIKYIDSFNPDVIHLRNIHGHYLNLPLLFKYLTRINKPVILNLHDCWAFTGHCSYYTEVGCDKWKSDCGNCPKRSTYPQSWIFDFSKKMKCDKEKWFASIKNLTVVGVSNWIADQARCSFLRKAEITRIYNWINLDIFKPYKHNILNQYGMELDKFTIIGVSSIWKSGTPRYEDFMKLGDMLDDTMQILLIGGSGTEIKHKRILQIPFVKDITELAKIYSSADVFIHFSIEDTFGKVIAEAIACGTPTIVYDSTGCSEILGDKCGYVVPPRDLTAVYEKIREIKTRTKEYYKDECVKRVHNEFNYKKNISSLISLYTRLGLEND